jgi:GNAT superfamily N-acetyltransferase
MVSRSNILIEPFDPVVASESDLVWLHRFTTALRLESLPDDPPTPLDVAVRAWRTPTSLLTTRMWVAREDDDVIGRAQLQFPNTAENRHAAKFTVQVLADRRRQGLGRRLLEPLAAAARGEGRTLLVTDTSRLIPGGAAFVLRLGARAGMEATIRQLAIAELDRRVIAEWCAGPPGRDAEFELLLWVGPYPESHLDAAAALYEVMNTAPRGDIAVEDQRITREHLREVDRALSARGAQRWTLVARERATGRLAGFTDVVWSPGSNILNQVNTGVLPEDRGRGLARWLKAAMLDRVLRELPEVQFVRTANADSNASMVRINEELGFKPYSTQTVWQAELERIEAYLSRRG